MKNILPAILILLVLTNTRCQKKIPKCETIPGVLEIMFKDSISIDQIRKVIVKYNIAHSDFSNIIYTKVLPNDSLNHYMTYYFNKFKSVPYIENVDISKSHQDSFTSFSISGFIDININYFNWDSIFKKEQLKEKVFSGKDQILRRGNITVPAGEEDNWIDVLNKYPEIYHVGREYKCGPPYCNCSVN